MGKEQVKPVLKPCEEEPVEAVLRLLARMIAKDILRKQAVIRQNASTQTKEEEE